MSSWREKIKFYSSPEWSTVPLFIDLSRIRIFSISTVASSDEIFLKRISVIATCHIFHVSPFVLQKQSLYSHELSSLHSYLLNPPSIPAQCRRRLSLSPIHSGRLPLWWLCQCQDQEWHMLHWNINTRLCVSLILRDATPSKKTVTRLGVDRVKPWIWRRRSRKYYSNWGSSFKTPIRN